MTTSRTLIDTRLRSDAILCGYDGPADPITTTDGLLVIYNPPTPVNPASIDLVTGHSSVQLFGPEIRQLGLALETAVRAGLEPTKAHSNG